MRFVALSGNTVIGEGVVSRSHIHYVGKRGVSPDLIVPVPFRPGPGVRVVRREEDVAALDLGGGTWIARGVRPNRLILGDLIVPLDPERVERMVRPLRQSLPDNPRSVSSLDGKVFALRGVWFLRSPGVQTVYPLSLLRAFGLRALGRLGDGLAAASGEQMALLGAGLLKIPNLSFEALDFPMDPQELLAQIRQAWLGGDLSRLRLLLKARALLFAVQALNMTPSRWIALGEAIGLETSGVWRAAAGLSVAWNIRIATKEEK